MASTSLFFSCSKVNWDSTKKYQSQLEEEWNSPKTTPLHKDEITNFHGINFFPLKKKFVVNAVFEPILDGKTIPFPTSAKKIKYFKAYGKINFTIGTDVFQLTVFQSDPPHEGYEDELFIPFMDETNGNTTYGGGRYLDIKIQDIQAGKVVIDFNKAYNPYCAYSKYYNCPIPPATNFVQTEIKAGVRYP